MEANNRYMSDAHSQYNVDSEIIKQQFLNKDDPAFDENELYKKSSTTSQDSRTADYDSGKNDDFGPETNVDTLDDAGDSFVLANISRELLLNNCSDNNQAVENQLGDSFVCPSINTNELNNIASVDNVGDSDESDDEWNFYKIDSNQETVNSLQPKASLVSEVDEKIEEPKIIENNKDLLTSDEKLNLCNQNTNESEDNVNLPSLDKPKINDNIDNLLLPAIQNDCSEEMDFSLNPNAAEFVPVSSPSSIPSRFMDLPISGSPLKQTSTMDDINLPSPAEFNEEANHRPHEVEEEDNDIMSLNGNAFTGENAEELDEKKKVALNLDESEISSTRAEFGDESNISFLTTDFQKTSGFDGSFIESCSEYENDPMVMSVGPDGFNLLSNPVDLNAVHDLNDSDLCDINSLSEEKEQTLMPLDEQPQPLDFKSSNSNELQPSTTSLDHESTNNNLLCPLASSSEQLYNRDIKNNTDEITSQVVAMNLKNEQLSEVCLENTDDFTNNIDNIKDIEMPDNSSSTEQKVTESLSLECQQIPLENIEVQTSQNISDSSVENRLISCHETEKLEHQQELNLTDQCQDNFFTDSKNLVSHNYQNTQVIIKSEPIDDDFCGFKKETQEINRERDTEPDVSVSNNFADVPNDTIPVIAENMEKSVIENENIDTAVNPNKPMELSKSLQEFTGLEKELSPTENEKVIVKNVSEKPQIQDTVATKDITVENLEKSVAQTTVTELSTQKTKVLATGAKNTTTTTKPKSNKVPSKTVPKTSPTKSSTRVASITSAKTSGSVASRSTSLSTDTKKITDVGVGINSVDASKVSTSNKPSSKPGIKVASRLTSAAQSKSSTTKTTSNNTIEKKSTVTTNGEPKSTKIPPKTRPSTVDATSKPLVKSTMSSTRLTTTTKSKSSTGTVEPKLGLKTTGDIKSTGVNIRPKTAPSVLTVPKTRPLNSVKPSIVDKNIKETANKQISNRIMSTMNSKTSSQGLHSTNAALSATTKRTTTTTTTTNTRTTKQQSSLTRITVKNGKTSNKTNLSKTQLSNNVNETKNTEVVEESAPIPPTTISNTEVIPEKELSTPTIQSQQIIGENL